MVTSEETLARIALGNERSIRSLSGAEAAGFAGRVL
jgi:hypothetical protein